MRAALGNNRVNPCQQASPTLEQMRRNCLEPLPETLPQRHWTLIRLTDDSHPPTSPKTKPKAESPDDGGVLYEDTDTDEDEATDVEDALAGSAMSRVAGIEWNESPAPRPA
jgi:hypothetical protein